MKKIFTLLTIMLMITTVIGGCGVLKTPEELIQPPELNIEKKKLNDALLNYLPQNADLIVLPYVKGMKQESSLINKDIDGDGEKEAVALYRDKNTRKIGLIVMDKENDTWTRKTDIKLDVFEVADYKVIDTNNDGLDEIIIGYYGITNPYKEVNIYVQEQNTLRSIFKERYLALDVLDADEDGLQDIVISDFADTEYNNRVSVFNVYGNNAVKISEISYPKENEVYSISFGKVNDRTKAFFVDMYVNQTYGQTDVVVYEDRKLFSIIRDSDIKEIIQTSPIKSVDIDDDGITEVAKMQVIDRYDRENSSANNFVKNYYKITEKLELDLVSQVYEDIDMNINIAFPLSFKNNYFIEKIFGEDQISVYFSPQQAKKEVLFMVVKKVEKSQLDSLLGEYQLITEMGNMAVIAKVMDVPENMEYPERTLYDRMKYDARDLTTVIKPANL